MIKLLSLLLPIALLYGDQNLFLFPDQKNDFFHRLTQVISPHAERITLITPSFNQPQVKKLLLKKVRQGTHVDLIVQTINPTAAGMVQYDRINLLLYRPRPLDGSVILIDERYACFLGAPFEETHLSDDASFVRCSDDPDEIRALQQHISLLKHRSVPYLK